MDALLPSVPFITAMMPEPSRKRGSEEIMISAYLIADEKSAERESQKSAPAPPSDIPIATPTMFPIPRVPASASESEMTALFLSSAPRISFTHLIG